MIAMATALFLFAAVLPGNMDSLLQERFSEADARAITLLVSTAEDEGLPGQAMIQKALEGHTKGAPPDRILLAVERLLDRLRLARTVLGDAAQAPDLEAGAAALYAGVDTTSLSLLRRERPEGSLAVELIVLADLIERGVEPAQAVTVMASLISRDLPETAILAFRDEVETDLDAGRNPGSAIREGIERTLHKPEQPGGGIRP